MSKVVSIGIHIVDILGRYITEIPKGQSLGLIKEIKITAAGTAAGTSVDMAKLGLDVSAVGAIGTDSLGDFLLSSMQSYKIDTSGLVRKEGVQTSCSMLPIRPNGERPALHVVGANGLFSLEDVNWQLLADADFVHMGGTSLLPKLDGLPTAQILKFAKDNGAVTTFDLVAIDTPDLLDMIKPCLPYIDYFMPGFEEAQMMTGLSDRIEIIKYFLDAGVKCTVFKMGEKGSSIAYYDKDGSLCEKIIPIVKQENIVDSTGCGDSYCAGFIKGLSLGWDIEKCAQLGSACGSLVITGLGSDAGIENFEQVENLRHQSFDL